ncbi:MarR family transcriptional regulator [Actinomadura rudentiformis]|uniref:MarR family transcriptional regulator n=1 Tax=Actinomadura rudentiformis TaxID=359158 RepID=A0A6H9YR17_9ACTN|nr:MarR family transcriptional regulator [Actinomadura rudentiformis]KAB2343380.1 MarR family transcriptional regulator [Actinomadura rudentiformis]
MRSDAPPLLPIFRSRHQADLLTVLFFHPGQDFTLADLSRRLGVSMSTLHGEVGRLLDAELITARPVGRSRLLRANTGHLVADALARLLTLTFGPQVAVADSFAQVAGVRTVLIFGSWARRYEGEAGPAPNDVDVLVLGDVDRAEVYEAAEAVQDRLDLPVNPVVRPPDRWLADTDPLVQQVKASPFVIAYGDLPADG